MKTAGSTKWPGRPATAATEFALKRQKLVWIRLKCVGKATEALCPRGATPAAKQLKQNKSPMLMLATLNPPLLYSS